MSLFRKSPETRLLAALEKLRSGAADALDAFIDLDPAVKARLHKIRLELDDARLPRFIYVTGAIGDMRDEVAAALQEAPAKKTAMLLLRPARGSSITVSYDRYAFVVGEDPGVQSLRLGETAVRTVTATRQDLASAGYRAPEVRGRGLALGKTVISKVPA